MCDRGVRLSAIGGGDVVLALVAFERHLRDVMLLGKGLHRLNEPIMQGPDHNGRRHWEAEVVAKERRQLATRLQRRQVAVEVQPIRAASRQDDVLAQYGGEAWAGHRRRLPRRMVGTRRWCHPSTRLLYQPRSQWQIGAKRCTSAG